MKNIKIFKYNINIFKLSKLININIKKLIKKCDLLKININNNINQILSLKDITLLCNKFNYKVSFIQKHNKYLNYFKKKKIKKNLIIVIIGEVDHGKTTFIDYLKKTNITNNEVGKITQKINICNYTYKKNNLLFIDTPGHKDFINLKLQSLKIANIILLFISCEINNLFLSNQIDEIFNYTNNYKNIKFIFVITKIDIKKYNNNLKLIKNILYKKNNIKNNKNNFLYQEISTKKKKGINNLLNKIIINNNNKFVINTKIPNGYILYSYIKKKTGYFHIIILNKGKINLGDYILCNIFYSKIKKIFYNKKKIKKININIPIKIMGLKNAFNFGEKFFIYKNKKKLKKHLLYNKNNIQKNIINKNIIVNKKKIFKKKKKKINIIIKYDLLSSINAILILIKKINNKYNNIINIINKNIGEINKNDLILSKITNSIIICFNIKTNKIKNNKIKIKYFYVIYDINKYFKKKIIKFLKKKKKGLLIVKNIYNIKDKIIYGCYIIKGIIKKKYFLKIKRNKKTIIKKTKINSLKHFNKKINKIKKGKNCGIIINNKKKLLINDTIIVYK
ncbi:MAG: GTP-binding protein [Candidatus Shikimatogenerans sp. Ttur]|uniref:GTP-binding protein n=1 Tax=Candidatus Shikimatogenerans sp. Ttur TaxID=3158569 RepID=A0AAU7ZY08_9FLAO